MRVLSSLTVLGIISPLILPLQKITQADLISIIPEQVSSGILLHSDAILFGIASRLGQKIIVLEAKILLELSVILENLSVINLSTDFDLSSFIFSISRSNSTSISKIHIGAVLISLESYLTHSGLVVLPCLVSSSILSSEVISAHLLSHRASILNFLRLSTQLLRIILG